MADDTQVAPATIIGLQLQALSTGVLMLLAMDLIPAFSTTPAYEVMLRTYADACADISRLHR